MLLWHMMHKGLVVYVENSRPLSIKQYFAEHHSPSNLHCLPQKQCVVFFEVEVILKKFCCFVMLNMRQSVEMYWRSDCVTSVCSNLNTATSCIISGFSFCISTLIYISMPEKFGTQGDSKSNASEAAQNAVSDAYIHYAACISTHDTDHRQHLVS